MFKVLLIQVSRGEEGGHAAEEPADDPILGDPFPGRIPDIVQVITVAEI
jgi:hypothetical protein